MFHLNLILGESGTSKTELAIENAITTTGPNGRILYLCRGFFNKLLVNDLLINLADRGITSAFNWTTCTPRDLAMNLDVLNKNDLKKIIDIEKILSLKNSDRPLVKYLEMFDAVILDQAEDFQYLFPKVLGLAGSINRTQFFFVMSQSIDGIIGTELRLAFPAQNLILTQVTNPLFVSTEAIILEGFKGEITDLLMRILLEAIELDPKIPAGAVGIMIELMNIGNGSSEWVRKFGHNLWLELGQQIPNLNSDDIDPERRLLIAPKVKAKGIRAVHKFIIQGPKPHFQIPDSKTEAQFISTQNKSTFKNCMPLALWIESVRDPLRSLREARLLLEGDRVQYLDSSLDGNPEDWWIEIARGAARLRIHPNRLKIEID